MDLFGILEDGSGIVGRIEKGFLVFGILGIEVCGWEFVLFWIFCLRNLVFLLGFVDWVKFVVFFDFWEIFVFGNVLFVGFGDGDFGVFNFEDGVVWGEFWVEMFLFLRKGRDLYLFVYRDNIFIIVVNKSLCII